MDRGKICVLLAGALPDGQLERALEERGLVLLVTRDVRETLARLEMSLFHAVFVASGESALLQRIRERCADELIVAVGAPDDAVLRSALETGATDYLPWPSPSSVLDALLARVQAHARVGAFESSPATVSGLIGSSPQMAAVRDTLARIAIGTATTLIRGETGTGKELAARAVHALSARHAGPFVKVNAPAVPDALLESELFGYEKGAFTGATMRKPGRVELAEGGTLFLDEIGEVSPVMQAKLLRLIQDREYERLGGTRTLRADVRFVAATHRDLEHMVAIGSFREDLFYRLNVVTLWLPPLRARRNDIAAIATHYLSIFRSANAKPQLALDDAALHVLQTERWPGNVRQLVNFIERLVVLARGPVITAADVQAELQEQFAFLTQAAPVDLEAGLPKSASSAPLAPEPLRHPHTTSGTHFSSAVRPLKEDLRRTEYRAITKALASAKGNRALAARLLGISRRTLYTKLEEHGIE